MQATVERIVVVSRVTKIEQEKERNGNGGSRRDRKRHGRKSEE